MRHNATMPSVRLTLQTSLSSVEYRELQAVLPFHGTQDQHGWYKAEFNSEEELRLISQALRKRRELDPL